MKPRTTSPPLLTLRRLLTVVVLALCACGAAPPRALIMRDVQFQLRDLRFPSGLRVIVEEDHRAPLVGVFMLVGVGSTSDPPGKEGLAHYVEHLAFRSRPDKQHSVWHLIERTGAGVWNASTGWDRTLYFEVGPKEALPGMLLLEGARLLAPVADIPADVVAVEREVVRNELRQRNETGYAGAAFGWLQAAVFPPGHPYARPVIGTHESLSAITIEDAQRFAKAHYRPENTTIVVVGDVDLQTVGRVIEESLPPEVRAGTPGAARGPRLDPVAPEPPEPVASPMIVKEGGVAAPELWIGWSLPRSVDANGYLDRFVARAARERLPGAYWTDTDIAGVRVSLVGGKQAAMLICQVQLKDAAHAERSADHVLNRLIELWNWDLPVGGRFLMREARGERVQQRELNFVQEQRTAVTGMMLDAEDFMTRGQERADLTHFSGDPGLMSRGLTAIMSIDGVRVSDFAHKYLTRDRARTVLIKPLPGSAPPPAGESGVGSASQDEAPPSFDMAAIRAFVRPPGVGAYRRVLLDNGLEAFIGRRAGLPVVTVGVSLHGGASAASPPGADELERRLGRVKVTSSVRPGEFGAHVWDRYRRDELSWTIEGSSGNADNMLALLAEWVPSKRVDSMRFTEFLRDDIAVIQRLELLPEARANRLFWRALYGDHPYGHSTVAAELSALSAGDADRWIGKIAAPRNAVVAIVGEVDPDAIAASLKDTFGSWSSSGAAVAPPPPPALPEARAAAPRISVVHRAGATQGELRYGCLLPPAASSARYSVMSRVVSDRLWSALRKTLGATYGFQATVTTLRGGAAHLAIDGAVDNAHLGKALAIVRKTLDDLGHHKLEASEVDAARWRAARAYGVGFQTNEAIVRAILEARNQARAVATIDAYPADLAAITAGGLRADFIRCTTSPVLSAVGDESALRAAIAEAWP